MAKFTREEVIDKVSAGVSLERADLKGIDLSGANLEGADFTGAKLIRSNLSRANLKGATLVRARLPGANLSGANLASADLTKADLYRVELYGADLSGAILKEADLSGAYLFGADLIGSNLVGADMSWANFFEADLTKANLRDSSLTNTDFERATLKKADLSGANIYNFKTPGWNIEKVVCTHVFSCPRDSHDKVKEQSRREFRAGEFEEIYQSTGTIELCFAEEFSLVDELRFTDIFAKLRENIPEATIKLKKKEWVGNDMIIALGVEEDETINTVAESVQRLYNATRLAEDFSLRLSAINDTLLTLLPGSDYGAGKDGKSVEMLSPLNINIFTAKGQTIVLGQGELEAGARSEFSRNYLTHRADAEKLFVILRRGLPEDRQHLLDQLSETLRIKDDDAINNIWREIIRSIKPGTYLVEVSTALAKLLGIPE
ncbi:MAG: pentapeptide repeat-containing protein [Thermodesulfobacteriota bacterium]